MPRNPRTHRKPLTLEQIRLKLDEPRFSEPLQRLPLRERVRVDALKDKIAEALSALVNQPAEFHHERLRRQKCARLAEDLRQFRILDDKDRTHPRRRRIDVLTKNLERRATGIERYGRVLIREHFLHEQTDRKFVSDLALLNLFAILRHLTEPRRSRRPFFETIGIILQGFGALPQDEEEHFEAVRKRFTRANRWPKIVKGPPPVDFCQHLLFSNDPRFPPQPPVLPSTHYSVSTTRSPSPGSRRHHPSVKGQPNP